MANSDYDLAERKNGNGTVHSHDQQEADLGVEVSSKLHISMTQIDEGDMYRLGKKQELNVWTTSADDALLADTSSATSTSSLSLASPWS